MKCKKFIAAMLTAAAAVGCFCVTAGAAVSKTGNLITDGGFETTSSFTSLDWKFQTYDIWYSGGSIAADGENHYAEVTNTGIGQNVAVEANKTYILSAKVKSTGSTALCIQNGDAAWPGNQPGETLASTDITASDDWQTITVEYTTTSAGHLFAYLWSPTGVTTCIDDVKLVEVDPAESFDYTADEELAYTDATGFTYTFTPAGAVNNLT
ncbi:MAG: carbohydrate binding domain-containing protein, partial [Candidatus Ornithomonoglobus sp.]